MSQENRSRRGRPRHETTSPLGRLIVTAMKLLGLSYKDIVRESERLAHINNNPDMRVGKSTLGNIISGSIRQPGTAKLDSLRIILHLSRADIDAAIGEFDALGSRLGFCCDLFRSRISSCMATS